MTRFLLKFSKNAKRYLLASILCAGVAIFFNFLMPRIVGFTVDSVIGDAETNLPAFLERFYERLGGREYLRANLIVCSAGVVLSAVISGAFNFLSRSSLAAGTERFTKNLRDALYRHTQFLPFSWHTEHLTGDIIQRCTSDVETARRFISQQLIDVVRTVILVVLALVIMFSMHPGLAAMTLGFIPFIMAYNTFFFLRIARKFKECDETEGVLMTDVQENLTGVRVVRAFGRERHELKKFDKWNDLFAKKWIDLGLTLGVYWGVGDVVSAIQLMSVVAVGAYLAATGRLTLGELLVFISYTTTMAWPVRQLGRTLSEMSKAGVSFGRMKEILDAPAEEPGGETEPPLRGDIEFKNVTFSYDDTEVLHDVSFTVKAGTTFGILGATGSGKSTITYLLNRLYELPEGCGEITIGGMDIRKMDRYALRRGVGLVLQEPFLFSRTILENIDLASRSGDRALIKKRAAAASIDGDIEGFSDGYDTMVGERGVTLSGGQKQRVAIARTLMTGAPIMVFDDSMSSLDMETDARIQKTIREETKDATVLLISHRISTLMRADKIIVLENGRVIESGTHWELLEHGGVYRRVYDIQTGGGEADA